MSARLAGSIAAGLALLCLAGCASDMVMSSADAARMSAQIRERDRAVGRYNSVAVLAETSEIEFSYGSPELHRMSLADFERVVNETLLGYTVAFTKFGEPVQIEYYAPDGRVALWFPGNAGSVPGHFTTRVSVDPYNAWGNVGGVLACFTYPADSGNASSGQSGAEETCTGAYSQIAGIAGKRHGDVFGLMDGSVPYPMPLGLNRNSDNLPDWPDGSPVVEQPVPHHLPDWVE
jgi:hypothetical protein